MLRAGWTFEFQLCNWGEVNVVTGEKSTSELRQQALVVHQRLLSYYGMPTWRPGLPPVAELVSTILSQNTNDHNRDLAYQRLVAAFPTWEQVRDADLEKVIEAIRSAGLGNQKGRRIQAVLREITRQRGSLDLSFLKDLSRDQALEWLKQFKGVGPKTAAIVLQFSLGVPAMPVDTHIYRVTGRIGLRPEKLSVEQTHLHMETLLPPESYFAAHLNLIRLGREICHPRHPDCPMCPLNNLCAYALGK